MPAVISAQATLPPQPRSPIKRLSIVLYPRNANGSDHADFPTFWIAF